MFWFLVSTGLVLLAVYIGLCIFYYIVQERLIFVRFRLPQHYSFRFPGKHTEEQLRTADGALLHALHFHSPASKGIVLYFHGNTGSLKRWGKVAPRFTAEGLDVLMPDPRGYGKSRGDLSEAALHADADLWYAHLRKSWPEEKIIIYGRSLGSGLAVPLAADHRPRCLILETPFANLIEVARFYLRILPYEVLLKYRFRNDKCIHRVKCPVYIFHGQRDRVVPYSSALKLYGMIPATVHRELFTFPKGAHSDLARFKRFNLKMREILRGPEGTTTFAPLNSTE